MPIMPIIMIILSYDYDHVMPIMLIAIMIIVCLVL